MKSVESVRDENHLQGLYLDCNATTPLDPSVLDRLGGWAIQWGNPSSIHWAGRGPKLLIRETRQKLANYFDVNPLELIFTSGGSESNSTVIQSVFKGLSQGFSNGASGTPSARQGFITSQVEHPSVTKTMRALAVSGAQVDFIPVSSQGVLDLDFYKEKLSSETALVSVMAANNETGHLFPIEKLSELAHQAGSLFHTDAVQALGKIDVPLKKWGVDYASFSAHKCYALKGVGALFAKRGAPLESLIFGGGQERHRRGGTENVLGIAAFGQMAEQIPNLVKSSETQILELRNYLENRIVTEIPDVHINGRESPRLPNTSSLVLRGIDGETLLMSLDLKGFAVSTGAACSSGSPEPSPTLLAMGLTRNEAQSSLRLSLGAYHTQKHVDHFVEVLRETVDRLRNLNFQTKEDLNV